MRDLFGASNDLGPSPFDGLDSGDGFGASQDDEDEDEVDDETPRVVLGTIDQLGTGAPELVARFGDRPIWFIVDEQEELVGVFERHPEQPLAETVTSAILGFLRAFSSTNALPLQSLLGPTDRLRFGFHTSASLEEVVESFEDDGFDVLLGLSDGNVELPGN